MLEAHFLPLARALALLWTWRQATAAHRLLQLLPTADPKQGEISLEEVNNQVQELFRRGDIVEMPREPGYYRLRDGLRREFYSQILADTDLTVLRRALFELESFRPADTAYYWPVHDRSATVAIFRLALFAGTPAAELDALAESIAQAMDREEIIAEAAFAAFDGDLYRRIDPEWRRDLLHTGLSQLCRDWQPDTLAMADWALARVRENPEQLSADLRLVLAEWLMAGGDGEGTRMLLATMDNATGQALEGCLLAQAGDYPGAQAAFEQALKRRQAEVPARKRIFPATIAWFYPLVLLAQHTPNHLELAHRFCQGEAGSRSPDPYEGWGRWVHATGVRLGETILDPGVFVPSQRRRSHLDIDDLWRLLLAAWMGADALGLDPDKDPVPLQNLSETVDALRERLRECRLFWLEAQVAAAAAVLAGETPEVPFFAAEKSETWRDVLAALQALGADQGSEESGTEGSRLVWSIAIAPDGALAELQVLEQKHGPRGWSKLKPVSLGRIAGNPKLPPWDAKVAPAIRRETGKLRGAAHRYSLDRAAALMALVGHPAVIVADTPEQFVEVVEGKPEIEVVRGRRGFVMRVKPPLRPEGSVPDQHLTAEEYREQEALRAITLIRDSVQRVRVIQFTAAQQRAARLVADRFAIPTAAREELQKALRALAEHFQVQADQAQAARELATDSRLRAELAPAGEGLLLRLVVAPLGPDGPRLTPGRGRSRLMAALGGETVSTERRLQAEQENLDAVLSALDFLDEPDEQAAGFEWTIDDPEAALTVLERLPTLEAVAAVDWPKGQPIRVLTVDSPQVAVSVATERDWFRLFGEARVEEGLVLKLEQLLQAGRDRSRFVPMGNGVYAALSRQLKEQLAGLAAVAETDRLGARLPRLASAWADEALAGMAAQSDQEFRNAVERLRRAQEEAFSLPRGLQAELRPYQEEGYYWAMRLAMAGFGACLADDMGLGKTLQALAVLLARASGGPALILAPTSVSGNWRNEAERFAPGLDVAIYGEGDRDQALADLGPGAVRIVSYGLFQQAQDRFVSRRWHTVVVDEAQAIKNAAAKRSLAVFELQADFRLALSGTPVENRLAELWSIMRFVNPGLLGPISRFNERFALPIERHRDRHAQRLLRRLIGPFVLRRTKTQVLTELPPRTELLLTVDPEPEEAALYEALRRQAEAAANEALADPALAQVRLNILGQLTRLRRAACDPRLAAPAYESPGAKVQAFADLATELSANGHKALVFSQFVDFLHLLRSPLDEAGIPYQYLDGAVPAAERTRRVAAFQGGEGDIFLISLKAGGFGLNLTAADYVVITDPWWNPAAEDQAMGRAHRMGQQRPVTVYRLVSRGTVEERIVALHRDKRALAESVVAEGEAMALPSIEDMVSLIRETGPRREA